MDPGDAPLIQLEVEDKIIKILTQYWYKNSISNHKIMFSIFKKKTVIPHVRLTGVIGSAGKFKQGLDLAGQKEILKKAFSLSAFIFLKLLFFFLKIPSIFKNLYFLNKGYIFFSK